MYAIRSYYVKQNSFPIRVVERIEEPFEWTLRFVYETQKIDSEPIWWRIAKTDDQTVNIIGLKPKNVLLLYE